MIPYDEREIAQVFARIPCIKCDSWHAGVVMAKVLAFWSPIGMGSGTSSRHRRYVDSDIVFHGWLSSISPDAWGRLTSHRFIICRGTATFTPCSEQGSLQHLAR